MTILALRRPKNLVALAALLATAGGMLVLSPTAHADPTPFDPKTSIVATRLPLVGGAGRLPLQLQIGGLDSTVGFDIQIPAGTGTWTAKRDITLTDLGIHCIEQPGADLHYICGQHTLDDANGTVRLKRGKFSESLPVQYSGNYAGLVGTISLYKTDSYNEVFTQSSDTFPVVDNTVPKSNAEVRNLVVDGTLDDSPVRFGDLAITVTVVGGESKTTGIDVALPSWLNWTLLSTKGGGQLTCTGAATTIHCAHLVNGVASAFPNGIFTAVLHLSETEAGTTDYNQPTVALNYANGTSQLPDTFDYFINYQY